MLIAVYPVLAVLIGLLVYVLSGNPKTSELGRLTFACGMLVLLVVLATKVLRIG